MTQPQDIRDHITQLESRTGDGTELVTVTIPPEKSLDSIRSRIAQEYAGAANIKSDQTRDRVQQALKRIQRLLRQYHTTPDNGLVVYAGVIDGDLESYVFDELPQPVTESTYRCDDQFDTSPLHGIVTPDDVFGLIVVERGGGAVGTLTGQEIRNVRSVESQVMGKSRAGGQSAKRFERERERQAHEFFHSLGDLAANTLLVDGTPVTGVVVGGTLGTAKEFVDSDYLDYRLRDRVLGTYSVEYGTEQGLQQLVEKAKSAVLEAKHQTARDTLDSFYTGLRDSEKAHVAYGHGDVERAIEFGAVETGILATSLSKETRREIQGQIEQQGGEVVTVSPDSPDGERFVTAFNGIGALLRFPVR